METLLTVEQYAMRAQLHPDSVRRQLREGRLRAIKKGRVWRIPASALNEDSRSTISHNHWANAAARMASVYADALATDNELTKITSAAGDFYESESQE